MWEVRDYIKKWSNRVKRPYNKNTLEALVKLADSFPKDVTYKNHTNEEIRALNAVFMEYYESFVKDNLTSYTVAMFATIEILQNMSALKNQPSLREMFEGEMFNSNWYNYKINDSLYENYTNGKISYDNYKKIVDCYNTCQPGNLVEYFIERGLKNPYGLKYNISSNTVLGVTLFSGLGYMFYMCNWG